MDIAIMLVGQNGLNWPRFQRIARAVEDLGFAGLYRVVSVKFSKGGSVVRGWEDKMIYGRG